MLFRYTEAKSSESMKIRDAVSVSKCHPLRISLYPIITALFISLGVLSLVYKPVRHYATISVVLFFVALVPILYLIDALTFRILIGDGKIVIKRFAAKEEVYPYTDLSWKLQNPKSKRSAILLYSKDKSVARILPRARNYNAVLSLRHKGTLTGEEKTHLRRFGK